MTTLYNLHTDGDQYRITKFIDGNPESSYLLSHTECQCPAGHRPTCRHRQMLPQMLAEGIDNTHWFWHFERGEAMDINGSSKILIDSLSALHPPLAEGHALQEPNDDSLVEQINLRIRPALRTWRRI